MQFILAKCLRLCLMNTLPLAMGRSACRTPSITPSGRRVPVAEEVVDAARTSCGLEHVRTASLVPSTDIEQVI